MQTLETSEGSVHLVRTRQDAAGLRDWLTPHTRAGTWLGLDSEFTANNQFSRAHRLRTVQMSDGINSFVIHHERPELAGVTKTLVRGHDNWVAHFAEADIRAIECGVPGTIRLDSLEPHVRDTQTVLAYYDPRTVTGGAKLDPRIRLDRALKPTVTRILGSTTLAEADQALVERFRQIAPQGVNSVKAVKAYGFENISIDDEVYNAYAGLDAMMEIRLSQVMMAEVERRGQLPIVMADLRRQWHVDLMTLRGMPIDIEYVKWLDGQLEQVVRDNMVRLCQHKVAISGMGPSVGAAFNKLGVISTRETKSGGDSWDAQMMEIILENGHLAVTPAHHEATELAKAVTLVRKSGKFRSAYIAPMLETADRDGRVHPSRRMCGAVTGRGSAKDPPVDQIPKRKDKRVRPAFIAPPGWKVVTCDFSRGEPSVMAALSEDPQLRHDCLSSDLNGVLATRTYGSAYVPEEGDVGGTISYEYRQRGKAGFLARCYGCMYRKLASLLKVDNGEAQEIMRGWDAAYPRLAAYTEQLNALPVVTLRSGRIVPLWDTWEYTPKGLVWTGKPSRLGLNAVAQGELSDLMRLALDDFIARGWSWALLTLVHDEIVACVPEAMAQQCADVLKECMTMELNGFPIGCDAKVVGSSWMPRPEEYDSATLGEIVLNTDVDGYSY